MSGFFHDLIEWMKKENISNASSKDYTLQTGGASCRIQGRILSFLQRWPLLLRVDVVV